ncbi:unnamed protein product [Paramecium sonneborni]|uniref:Protein kinase domain-containing protein n=1 Tax=Paramecium sonneborni TaxID=65129 RepID=A0A8S1M222_9CILI|nr:unnamed protein product [Paramecium sonneborni]
MSHFSCQALFKKIDGQLQEVIITTQSGALLIVSKNENEQMVYLPSNSMDTILCFGREIDENQQIGTLDLDNPETKIKVTFYIGLNDISKLKFQMRGRQIFMASSSYVVLGKLASGIKLIQTPSRILVEKKASFLLKDQQSHNRLAQLKQETDMLRLLKDQPHKNIILLEEIVTDYKSVSIILEYCQGGDLLKLLYQKSTQIDIPRLMFNLLSGLKHLHNLEIVHRDIKLQNILFKDSQNVDTLKIADFGFSCKKSQIQYINPRCGTPGYTAPEVFSQDGLYDEKIDIYSSGIVFYNILTFKNPFGNSQNISDLIKLNISGNYNEAHLETTKMNNPLAYDLLTKMLQKESQNRPSVHECLSHPYFKNYVKGDFIEEMISKCRKQQNNKKKLSLKRNKK